MQPLALTLLLLASCGKASPTPKVVPFADAQKLDAWFHEQCSVPRSGMTYLQDFTLPPGAEHVRIFTVPMRGEDRCGGKLANLMNVRVELQGDGAALCAVRLGPADALASIDARFIEDWFTDKPLGARAAGLIGGPLDSSGQRVGMLDGIRIAVQQRESTGSPSQFFLVVDGCGRLRDANPRMSRFW